MTLDELVRGLDARDVRDMNRTDERVASLYLDAEAGKETIRKAWNIFCVIGWVMLALFALTVAIGLLQLHFG